MVRCIPGTGGGDFYDDDDDNDEDNNDDDNHNNDDNDKNDDDDLLFDTTTNLGLMHIISMMFQSLSAVSVWQGIAWMMHALYTITL